MYFILNLIELKSAVADWSGGLGFLTALKVLNLSLIILIAFRNLLIKHRIIVQKTILKFNMNF